MNPLIFAIYNNTCKFKGDKMFLYTWKIFQGFFKLKLINKLMQCCVSFLLHRFREKAQLGVKNVETSNLFMVQLLVAAISILKILNPFQKSSKYQ